MSASLPGLREFVPAAGQSEVTREFRASGRRGDQQPGERYSAGVAVVVLIVVVTISEVPRHVGTSIPARTAHKIGYTAGSNDPSGVDCDAEAAQWESVHPNTGKAFEQGCLGAVTESRPGP